MTAVTKRNEATNAKTCLSCWEGEKIQEEVVEGGKVFIYHSCSKRCGYFVKIEKRKLVAAV